jgi:serine/threonine protein kinase
MAATPQADVWALGVCLAVILTGKYPYDGNTLEEIGRASQLPINFTIYPWNFLSDGLRDLIQQMLKVQPDRIASPQRWACSITCFYGKALIQLQRCASRPGAPVQLLVRCTLAWSV